MAEAATAGVFLPAVAGVCPAASSASSKPLKSDCSRLCDSLNAVACNNGAGVGAAAGAGPCSPNGAKGAAAGAVAAGPCSPNGAALGTDGAEVVDAAGAGTGAEVGAAAALVDFTDGAEVGTAGVAAALIDGTDTEGAKVDAAAAAAGWIGRFFFFPCASTTCA